MTKPRHRKIQIWAPVTPATGLIRVEWPDGALSLTPTQAGDLGARLLRVSGVVQERRRREVCEREADSAPAVRVRSPQARRVRA